MTLLAQRLTQQLFSIPKHLFCQKRRLYTGNSEASSLHWKCKWRNVWGQWVAHLAKASKDTDKSREEDVQQEALPLCNRVMARFEEQSSR